jgi:DNA mismatch repair protein MutS
MPKKSEKITPIRRQYLEIKRQYPDAILFFRLGDFYETFDDDAHTVSRILDIVLTSRNVAKGTRVPMAGIPHHAMENYLGRLIDNGYHVAICEQIGDQPVKGLMPRKVVRVVTPGTVVEESLLPEEANNYLASVIYEEDRGGIAYVDITTGEFSATEIFDNDIKDAIRAELIRLQPAEILFSESRNGIINVPGHLTSVPHWRFEFSRCESELLEHFGVATLDGYGITGLPLAIRSTGAIIQYLKETQPASLKLISGISTYKLSEFMTLDASTIRNLELTQTIRSGKVQGSLLGILDNAVTPMGKRLLRHWVSKPLLDVTKIKNRQKGVLYFFSNGLLRSEFRTALRDISDLERLINRIVAGIAQPRDLVALRATLILLPAIKAILPENDERLKDILLELHVCSDELNLLLSALVEDPPAVLGNPGIFKPGFSAELDRVVESSSHAREWISDLESVERKRTNIKSLKVGYNKVFGYYIEVTKSNTDLVPNEYIRKQTLVNAERYITPEMKEYEALVLNAEERIKEIERRLFSEVCGHLSGSANRILSTASALSRLDVLAGLAETAAKNNYTRPEVVNDDFLDIKGGRHPVVEHTPSVGNRFVPNDAIFEEGERIRIITGPNMSGKSTFLRQVALIILMSQMGSFVPVESAKIGLVDRIFTRIGAQDEIFAGQSTFMVEMVETANILHNATNRSLLILDEIGRGTSTYDGVSIAWAVVEYIHNHPSLRAKTLFATHYHELTQLAELLPGVRNYNIAVSEADGEIVFLHKIVSGGTDRSYGIHVAQLAGLPRPVIHRAEEILSQLEATSGRAVKIEPHIPKQLNLFPETNPLLDELKNLDTNAISPIEALNRIYEWKKRFLSSEE